MNDEWFANEVAVRKAIGLLENRVEIPKLMEVSIDHVIIRTLLIDGFLVIRFAYMLDPFLVVFRYLSVLL